MLIAFGRPVSSVGSRIATFGIRCGSATKNLRCSSLLVITAPSVTSLPVPCVVGIATCGSSGRSSRSSPMFSMAEPPLVSATSVSLAASIELPPPRLTRPSAPTERQ